MKQRKLFTIRCLELVVTLFLFIVLYASKSLAQNYQPTPNDTLTSITILQDSTVSFKVYAPAAKEVRLDGPDIPDKLRSVPMKKRDNGVWEMVVGPLEPGSYRYDFIMDNIHVIDPRNPVTSESNMNTWSLFHLPGAVFMDTKDVPHGAVSEVTYFSKSLNRFRRMHIYTPPGYSAGNVSYPVLYLLHGAFDCDQSWSTVGRAGFIMDNLIADGKAVPMIVVMPAGHTGPFSFATMRDPTKLGRDEFLEGFSNDIKPYVEKNYRVLADRQHRALAGLSMGGAHTLNIAIPHLSDYAYFGVFSSGIFGITGPAKPGQTWEEQNIRMLSDQELKKDLKLVWFATGKDDFLIETSRATVSMLKKNGFDVRYSESTGGHTWKNWREYLHEFSQLLFK